MNRTAEHWILVMFCLVIIGIGFGTGITGMVTGGYQDNIDKTFDESSVYLWTPQVSTSLGGVAVSGMANGTGLVRSYLVKGTDFYLINEFSVNSESVSFDSYCVETCNLELKKNKYLIRHEIEGEVEYVLNSIVYSKDPITSGNYSSINITTNNTITTEDETITTTQHSARINKLVKWEQKIKVNKNKNVTVTLPTNAQNVITNKKGQEKEFGAAKSKAKKKKKTEELTPEDELITEYFTEAPYSEEEVVTNGKEILIVGPDLPHYTNVTAFTNLPNEISELDRVKLYWNVNGGKEEVSYTANDTNNNGLYDYLEWVVPHLSNQSYSLIIEISSAQHLDSNKEFIADIYDIVQAQDDNWVTVDDGEYVRVTFEEELDNTRDITIYAKSNGSATVEVYSQGSDVLLITFENVSEDKEYKKYLTELNGTEDTFDLKVVDSAVEFDYIVDPVSITDFISTWDTSKTSSGSSDATSVRLPLINGGNYDFEVDWGDGSTDTITEYNQAEVTHSYDSGGIYQINISGTLDGFSFNNGGDRLKLINISQWGNLTLGSSGGYFYGCTNLNISTTDILNTSGTTSFINAFRTSGVSTIPNISNWDMSAVTDLSYMFYQADSFNSNLTGWDVSNVTTSYQMFYGCDAFNGDMSNMNFSSNTNLANMFTYASAFNGNVDNWTIGAATLRNMFEQADAFNQDIHTWDTSKITSTYQMFYGTDSFNGNMQDMNWSSNTNFASMFQSAPAFNGNVTNWHLGESPISMQNMFLSATSFNQDIHTWDTSKVTTTVSMFQSAHAFNGSMKDMNWSNNANFYRMFYSATAFNGNVSNWYLGDVSTGMQEMFLSAPAFNQDLHTWDTSKVTITRAMFQSAHAFNGSMKDMNWSNNANFYRMFYSATAFNGNVSNWYLGDVSTGMQEMFRSAPAFNQPLTNWDTSKVTSMNTMFRGATSFDQDLGSLNVSGVTDFTNMLYVTQISTTNYDNLLTGWAALDTLSSSEPFHAGTATYCLGASARNDTLIGTYDWTITDGGYDCTGVEIPDTTLPYFTDSTPTNQTIAQGTALSYNINATDETALDCFAVNDSTNFAINCSGTLVNNTILGLGLYNLNITINDSSNNLNSSLMWVNVTDQTFPLIDFFSPTLDNGSSTTNTSVEINVSISELNLDEVKYNWNGTNFTMFNDSLVLMMNFDNVSALGENDTHVVDMSGNGNNGALTGNPVVNVTNCKYGNCFTYDGVGDAIIVAHDSDFVFSESMSTSLWVKPKTLPAGDVYFGKTLSNVGYTLRIDDASANNLEFYVGTGAGYMFNTKAHGMVAGNWYNIVAQYNGTDGELFVNGASIGSTSFPTTPNWGTRDLWIGGHATGGATHIIGNIDEVRIWNRSLTADEVYQQYVSNLNKFNSTQWYLYVNQSLNATDGLSVGDYTYFASAKDSAGNENLTEVRSLTIEAAETPDTTAPNISFEEPTEDNATEISVDSIYVNVSSADETSNISTFIDFDNSLVSWWRMDDVNASGDPTDYTGRNNGSLIGNALINASGKLGHATYFDGTGDYVNVGQDSSLNFSEEVTISTWIKRPAITSNSGLNAIVSRYDTDAAETNRGWYLAIYDANANAVYQPRFVLEDGSSTGAVQGTTTVDDNKWHHVVAVYNGTTQTIYVDGGEDNSGTFSGDIFDRPDENVYIGARDDGTEKFWKGYIDDVMIFNRSLSADEVLGLYANTTSKYVEANYTGLAEGDHTFKAYSQDLSGNVNETELRTLTVDAVDESAIQYVGQCGELNISNAIYNLNASVNNTGTCFTIAANNITLDCVGYEINYSYAGTLGYGINNSGAYNFTTIKNCVIKEGIDTTRYKYAIYSEGGNNGTIENNTITTTGMNGYGISLSSSSDWTIENNTITTLGSLGYGISLASSSNTTISNNNITTLINYQLAHGIYLTSSANNLVDNNLITINARNAYGVYLLSDSISNTINNNTISASATQNPSHGIYLASPGNTLSNNTITAFRISYGIYVTSNNNNIISNKVSSLGSSIYLLSTLNNTLTDNNANSSAANSYVIDGTIIDHFNHSIDSSNTAEGKPVNYSFNYNNLVYDGINLAQYGQIIFAWSNNITVQNSNITDDGISLFHTTNSTINNNFINSSTGYGIWLYPNSNNNNLSSNRIITDSTYGHGTFLDTSSNNILEHNNIEYNGTSAIGIYLYDSPNNNLTGNNLSSGQGAGYNTHGVYLRGSNNNVITSTIINISDTEYDSGTNGIYLYLSSNNVISNASVNLYGYALKGIYLYDDSLNNTISDSTFTITKDGGTNYALQANKDVITATFINTVLNCTNHLDIYTGTDTDAGSWLNFINVTFDETETSINDVLDLNVSWYLDVYVNDTLGNNKQGVNVSVDDVNNNEKFSVLTDVTGNIVRQTVKEYTQNKTGTYNYTPHSLNATLTGLSSYSNSSINISTNLQINIELSDYFPTISYVSPTLDNESSPTNTSVEINVSISEFNLDEVKYNWNGTNFTMFNDSLVLMMNFDNRSALGENDTYVVDMSGKGNDGSCSGDSCPSWSSSGKYDQAYSFDGGDYFSTGYNHSTNVGTIIYWVKYDVVSPIDQLVGHHDGNNRRFYIGIDGTGNTFYGFGDTYEGNGNGNPGVHGISAGDWHMLTLTGDGTTATYYVDSIAKDTFTYSWTAGTSTREFYIGDLNIVSGQYAVNGLIDEVRVWNRSLSASEVYQQYASNLNKFNETQWYLYVNQSLNATDGLPDGNYTYSASAKDDAGNENITELRTVTIDTSVDTVNPIINTAGGGGGGGGDGSIETLEEPIGYVKEIRKEIETTRSKISVNLIEGEGETEELTIINTGDTVLKLSIDIRGLKNVHSSTNSITLDPGKAETITLDFIAKETGVHTGNVLIETQGIMKSIPIVMKVATEKVLFDVKMDAERKELDSGKDLKTQITLLSMGKPKKVDVVITYTIKDMDDNTVWKSYETLAVDKELSFVKKFSTNNLITGNYIATVQADYEGAVAVAGNMFKVKGGKELTAGMAGLLNKESYTKIDSKLIGVLVVLSLVLFLIVRTVKTWKKE